MSLSKTALATCVAGCAAALAATPALASAASPRPPSAASATPRAPKLTIPMRVVGVDAAIARKHGYRVRRNAAGKRYVTKPGRRGDVTPYNVVSGDCGNSYMWLYADGSHDTTANTGFNVTADAISYSWDIAVGDNAGVAHHHFGGGLAFRSSWSGSWTSWHSVTGYSWAEVVSGYAVLWDGEICSTLYPWDWTNVY